MKYAQQTSVSVARSQDEIQYCLKKYGATGFMFAAKADTAMIGFEMNRKSIRFILKVPQPTDDEFRLSHGGKRERPPGEREKACEQETRRRWRALVLSIRAKLESVESGITTFEQEFLAHIVMPGGKSFGEIALPQIEKACETGKLPTLALPM